MPKMTRYDFFLKVLEDWEVREVLGGLGDSRRPRRFKEARDVSGGQEGPGDSGRPGRIKEVPGSQGGLGDPGGSGRPGRSRRPERRKLHVIMAVFENFCPKNI